MGASHSRRAYLERARERGMRALTGWLLRARAFLPPSRDFLGRPPCRSSLPRSLRLASRPRSSRVPHFLRAFSLLCNV